MSSAESKAPEDTDMSIPAWRHDCWTKGCRHRKLQAIFSTQSHNHHRSSGMSFMDGVALGVGESFADKIVHACPIGLAKFDGHVKRSIKAMTIRGFDNTDAALDHFDRKGRLASVLNRMCDAVVAVGTLCATHTCRHCMMEFQQGVHTCADICTARGTGGAAGKVLFCECC
jgi:hypothetical protein